MLSIDTSDVAMRAHTQVGAHFYLFVNRYEHLNSSPKKRDNWDETTSLTTR